MGWLSNGVFSPVSCRPFGPNLFSVQIEPPLWVAGSPHCGTWVCCPENSSFPPRWLTSSTQRTPATATRILCPVAVVTKFLASRLELRPVHAIATIFVQQMSPCLHKMPWTAGAGETRWCQKQYKSNKSTYVKLATSSTKVCVRICLLPGPYNIICERIIILACHSPCCCINFCRATKFNGTYSSTKIDGAYFIDRDGQLFRYVLELRWQQAMLRCENCKDLAQSIR